MEVTNFDKAIAGGIVSAVVALLARYGVGASAQTVTALGVVVTAVVSYGVGHVAVYFSKNKAV